MPFKRRFLVFLGINFGILAVIGIGTYLVSLNIEKRSKEILDTRSEINQRSLTTESLANLKKDAAAAKKYLSDLDILLPKRDSLVSFSRDIGIIANHNRTNASVTLGEEDRTEPGISKVQFVVTIQGTYDDITNTLNSLKNSRYFVKINSLEIARTDENNFRATANGQVFSFE